MKMYLNRLLTCMEETDELRELLQHAPREGVDPAAALAHARSLLRTIQSATHLPDTNGRNVLRARCELLLGSVRLCLCSCLTVALKSLGWPKVEQPLDGNSAARAATALVGDIINVLSAVQLASANLAMLPAPRVLWCVEAIAAPVIVRFQFHFRTPRPSNRPEKPEWMFVHVMSVLRSCRPFIEAFAAQAASGVDAAALTLVRVGRKSQPPSLNRDAMQHNAILSCVVSCIGI